MGKNWKPEVTPIIVPPVEEVADAILRSVETGKTVTYVNGNMTITIVPITDRERKDWHGEVVMVYNNGTIIRYRQVQKVGHDHMVALSSGQIVVFPLKNSASIRD